MKKSPVSQSGLFNARLILALCLCSVGLGLTIFSFASTPSSTSGVADSSGEPSIGSNWTKEAVNHNHNVNGSINNIPNGGTSLYFGGFSPAMAKVTWDDCSSPAGALWENKPLLSANTPRGFGDPILFTLHDTGRTFVAQL